MTTPTASAQALAALHTAPLAAHGRGWWDATFLTLVVLMDWFWLELPKIIQLVALIVALLTLTEKLIALGWIKNPRRQPKGKSDDAG